ncbi:4572_t:CDS:2, partial [Gigaspora rosea]
LFPTQIDKIIVKEKTTTNPCLMVSSSICGILNNQKIGITSIGTKPTNITLKRKAGSLIMCGIALQIANISSLCFKLYIIDTVKGMIQVIALYRKSSNIGRKLVFHDEFSS